MNILERIVESKRHEVEALRVAGYYQAIASVAPDVSVPSMAEAIRHNRTGIIAEFKRRSPSRGLINATADVERTVEGYASEGAAACSVLTDTPFFGGAPSDLARASRIAERCRLPLLRKEFIVSRSQILEARMLGASAVLLIASVLTDCELAEFTEYAHSVGLETLVEIHASGELDKVAGIDTDMIGVNSRNLADMSTDISHAMCMGDEVARRCPGALIVAESGIGSLVDIRNLRRYGYSGFLVGERFMRESDPVGALHEFLKGI
ncbi:indole-3-glycerol-phosphate synthase [Muribaculum sp.]|uniref:indole-3-glycerol phosphate synthase TrpC n=1 Tax=Muribaculum sp. TaxID=1918611 RepID=UPI0023C05DB5|nr:indole-3-glycerol phosphate synthase TrpC [Muribaculum sp.]MDE5706186.1 indole-3-glycerol phosphate synthase TrpC [Muribaculum sp.]MDE5922712.1 indole-3-glycerol phosphate synthase TrpC [Muribaculum sp.]